MNNSPIGNGKYQFFGYKIIDPNVANTPNATWDKIYNIYRKHNTSFHVTNLGVTSSLGLTLSACMEIRKEVASVLPEAHGMLSVWVDLADVRDIDIEPETTYEEIVSAIEDISFPDTTIKPF